MVWSKKYLLVLAFMSGTTLQTQVLLEGDTAATSGNTFSFNIGPKYFNPNTLELFVGRNDATNAGDSEDVKKYAVSAIRHSATEFIPLTPSTAAVNGVEDSSNPLHGEKISLINYFKKGPLIVRSDAPQNLYYREYGTSLVTSILKLEDIKDANGATTAGILKLAGSSNYVFAAVKVNGGNFGVDGAGIALIRESLTNRSLEQVAAVTGDSATKALPLDLSSSELKITNDLFAIDASIVDMHWDGLLQRLYICVKATGNTAPTDGARGVIVAYLQMVDNVPKLKFSAFAPAAAFSGTTYIVGGLGSSVVADIKKVRTMHTSTGVSYLITLGNSAGSNAATTVSALPVVNKRPASLFAGDNDWVLDTSQGVLASKTINAGTNLKSYFKTNGEIAVFVGRGFEVAASSTAHLTAQTDTAAQVGGQRTDELVTPGTVLDIQVHKDTVFVAVEAGDDQVRVYSSQALLDADGAIKAWTPWKPVMRGVTGTDEIYGIGYQSSLGHLYTLEGATSSTIKKVKTSKWSQPFKDGLLGGTTSDASIGIAALVKSAFTEENGGVQGLIDFPKETTAFNQTAGSRLSMMIATGYKKIMLIETGQDNGSNVFVPHVGSFSHDDNITITDGVLDTARTANTKLITISGGALNTVGAISTATIMNATTNGGYIIVGGVGGVAILRATSGGAGWIAGQLKKSFENIGTNKSFAIIGNYTHVRKVIADGQFLYVLTDKTFDRIPASQLNGTITPTVLATPTDLGLQSFDSFSDVVVSSKLALLATSKGLYRVGNGKNISTETSASNVDWTKITLPEGPNSVTRLFPVGTTTLETDFAQQTGGGMVYVLAASVGQQLSSLYRLAIRDVSSSAIAATTVEHIPDKIVSSGVQPQAHFGDYKNYFTTDGALSVVTRSAYNATAALAQHLPASFVAGTVLIPKKLQNISLFAQQLEMGKLVQSSALGSKIIPTSNGLSVLE